MNPFDSVLSVRNVKRSMQIKSPKQCNSSLHCIHFDCIVKHTHTQANIHIATPKCKRIVCSRHSFCLQFAQKSSKYCCKSSLFHTKHTNPSHWMFNVRPKKTNHICIRVSNFYCSRTNNSVAKQLMSFFAVYLLCFT